MKKLNQTLKFGFRMKRESAVAIDNLFFVNTCVSLAGHAPLLVSQKPVFSRP
jgi:hypothetical protein